jgi:hypothetical protein
MAAFPDFDARGQGAHPHNPALSHHGRGIKDFYQLAQPL